MHQGTNSGSDEAECYLWEPVKYMPTREIVLAFGGEGGSKKEAVLRDRSHYFQS